MQCKYILFFIELCSLSCTFLWFFFLCSTFCIWGSQKCNFYTDHTGLIFNCKIQLRQKYKAATATSIMLFPWGFLSMWLNKEWFLDILMTDRVSWNMTFHSTIMCLIPALQNKNLQKTDICLRIYGLKN